MSKFVLTAQLRLQAPTNVNQVLNNVRRQLQGVNIPVQVKGARQAQNQIQQVTKATQQASSAATALGRSFGSAVKRFAAFTVASRAVSLFTNSLANAVDEAIAFQDELVKISQVTGKSIRELSGLSRTIDELSISLGTSSKELLSTARILSQAGIKAQDLDVALEALAKTTLAATFDDINTTAEGAVAILSQFGQGVGALESQLGAINKVAGQFAVESSDLISAVRRTGGVFKAAGGDLNELLGLFTSVRATTRESSESIATGLRTIFTRIQRPKTIEFLKQFGIELVDLEGKFVGPYEAIRQLSQALNGLEEGDLTFVRIAEELGGFRQIGKVIPLLRQFETAERARQAAVEGGNSLTEDAATRQQALAIQITKVKEEFLALVRSIANSTSFQVFAKTALNIASALIKIADAIKPLIPLLATVAAFKFAQGIGGFFAGAGSALRGVQSFDPARRNQGGKIHAFARGGFVPGTGNRDTVPAMLTPGEFVIKKSSASKLGAGTLQAMNDNRYAGGGTVKVKAVNASSFGAFTLKDEGAISTTGNNLSATAAAALRPKVKALLGNVKAADVQGTQVPLDSNYNTNSLNSSSDTIKVNQGSFSRFLKNSRFNVGTPSRVQINRSERAAAESAFAKENKAAAKDRASELKKVGKSDNFGINLQGPFQARQIGGPKASVKRKFSRDISTTARQALTDAVKVIAKSDLAKSLDIPPINTDEARLGNFKRFLQGAQESVEGYLLEGVIGALTNATIGGGGTNLDFPFFSKASKDRLKKLFANDDAFIDNLEGADAKRQISTASSGDGALFNKIAKDERLKIALANSGGTIPKFAKGGPATDNVPALLTPGEFVINRQAAQSIGYGNLNSMNKTGVAKFARGGSVGIRTFQTGGANGPNDGFVQLITALNNLNSSLGALNQLLERVVGAARGGSGGPVTQPQNLSGPVGLPAPSSGSSKGDIIDVTARPSDSSKKQAESSKELITVGEKQKKQGELILKDRKKEGQLIVGSNAARKISARTIKAETNSRRKSSSTGTTTISSDPAGLIEGPKPPPKPQQKPTKTDKIVQNTAAGASAQGNANFFFGLTAAAGLVQTGLESLKPKIDENSSAFAKATASVISSFQGLITTTLTVIGIMAAFGIRLSSFSLKNINRQFRKLGIGVRKFGRRISSTGKRLQSVSAGGGRFGSGRLGKATGKLGNLFTKLGPQVARFGAHLAKAGPYAAAAAAALAAVAATAAIAYFAFSTATKAVNAYTGVHEKAKKAIEQGNVARAEEAAVASANTKAVDAVTTGMFTLGAVLAAISGPVGLVVGGLLIVSAIAIKVADAFGYLEGPINALRDSIGVQLGFASTNTIKEEAGLAAQKKRTELDLQKNSRESAAALARVAAGATTLAEEFEKGNLTGNIENRLKNLSREISASQSRIADSDKSKKGAAIGAAIGGLGFAFGAIPGAILTPIGAKIGSKFDERRRERVRGEELEKQRGAQEEFAQQFSNEIPTFVKAARSQFVASGGDRSQARDFILENSAAAREAASFTDEDEKRLKQLQGISDEDRSAADQAELDILKTRQSLSKQFNEALEQGFKEQERQLALIKALNFGFTGLAASLGGAVKQLNRLGDIDQVGNRFKDGLVDVEIALSTAAKGLKGADLDNAIKTIEDTLRDSGADQGTIDRTSAQVRGFSTALSRANEGTPEFAAIQERLKQPGALSDVNIRKVLSEELTKGLPPDVAAQVRAGIETAKIDVEKISQGDLGAIISSVTTVSNEYNKQVTNLIKQRSAAEDALIKATRARVQAEQDYVAAQRRAIDLQLEAAKSFENFGGGRLTEQQRSEANRASFNVGIGRTGVTGLRDTSSAEIQRVAQEIETGFNELENRARVGVVEGRRAFTDVDSDQREALKTLQQDLIRTTQQEIKVREDELKLIKEKNAAEKSSLEALISGDIEKFLEQSSAAGAGSALATGNQSLAALFSASALGRGLKTLEGRTDLTDQQRRAAEDTTLQRFGIQSTGVFTGTTAEEQAINAEGRALSATLGDLGQQAAEFERTEINTKQAIINASEVVLQELSAGINNAASNPRGLRHGGPVYASRGMFVNFKPRGTDTVPAMLTPGEFVVNRSAVNRGNNLQILRAMNSGGGASAPGAMSGGGQVKYYNLGGIVEGIAGAFSNALPNLTTVFSGFSAAVDKLIGTKFQVALDPTNVNINFNGASFLESLKDDIRDGLLTEVGNEIQKYKANNSGDLVKKDSLVN